MLPSDQLQLDETSGSLPSDVFATKDNNLDSGALEEARASIVTLKSDISDLRSQRNLYSPVGRLPAEILCIIFSLVKGRTHAADIPKRFQWIGLTHVCRRWRVVAIGLPTLWVKGPWPLSQPQYPWLEEMLNRTKEHPIVVKSDLIAFPETLQGLKSLLQQTSRIKHLAVLANPKEWLQVQESLPKSAPLLEHLSLSCTNPGNSSRTQKPVLGFQGTLYDVPKLRHLTLYNFQIDWNTVSHTMKNLTYLKIHGISSRSRPTWEELTDVFRETPNLEILDLEDAFPEEDDIAPYEDSELALEFPPTRLAFLHTLSFSVERSKDAETFLCCITFPASVKLKIQCFSLMFYFIWSGLPGFVNKIVRVISDAPTEEIIEPKTLLIHQHLTSPGMRFRIFKDELTDEQMVTTDPAAQVELDFIWLHEEDPARERALQDIVSLTQSIFDGDVGGILQSVTRVCLEDMSASFRPDTLAVTVGYLPQVNFIMASKPAHRVLIDALHYGLHEKYNGMGPFSGPYFPCLTSLYLHGRVFYPNSYNLSSTPMTHPSFVHNCIIRRWKTSPKLEKLTLKLWTDLDPEGLEMLRRIVHVVDCDDEEIPSDTESFYSDYVERIPPGDAPPASGSEQGGSDSDSD